MTSARPIEPRRRVSPASASLVVLMVAMTGCNSETVSNLSQLEDGRDNYVMSTDVHSREASSNATGDRLATTTFTQAEREAKERPSIAQYVATKEGRRNRVTLLGVTKGIAFVSSQELITEGQRAPGNNAVPWMRVAVVIEQLVGDDGLNRFVAQTADGTPLCQKIKVQSRGNTFTTRSRGTAELDLNSPNLGRIIDPTALPEVEDPDQAKVFAFTLSGDLQETEFARLLFTFGKGAEREDLRFENVPMP